LGQTEPGTGNGLLGELLAPGKDPGARREAIAEFVLQHQDIIRSIARRKLTRAARSVSDSEDVVSSVLRRLDGLALRGTLLPRSEGELWGLIKVITTNTAISKTQLIERLRNLLTEDGPYVYEVLKRLNSYTEDDEANLLVQRMLCSLSSSDDRQLLLMILRGSSHRVAAQYLKISEAASRQRWMRVKRELCERFRGGLLDG
jgi:DNA-directed RNA polymerase specialized sigma24 family protein